MCPCSTDKEVVLAQFRKKQHRIIVALVCAGGWGLTDDGAALAVSGQLVVEDDEEHGEAEHQRHLEGVALAAPQRQGEAHHVGQDDEDAGQHESDEGVEVFDGEFNLRGGERRSVHNQKHN